LKLKNDKNSASSNESALKRNSLAIVASFSLGQFLWNLIASTFGAQVQFFYENEILLDVWLYALAFIIYTVWNMFNDPIAGYFCDRSTRFTKRWGKRFPWIVIFAIPWCFSLVLVFLSGTVAQWSQWGVFAWLLITICLFDTVHSIWNINWVGLTPDKFRDYIERKQIGGFGSLFATLGGFCAFLIPPLFVKYGNIPSYITMSFIIAMIGAVSVILMILGCREDKIMRERRLVIDKKESESFFRVLKTSLKQKNFVAYCIAYLLWQTCTQLILTSLPYVNSWILGMPKSFELFPMIFYLITSLISIPLWYKLSVKYGCRKIVIIGFLMSGLLIMNAMFIVDALLTIILFSMVGFSTGAFFITMTAIGSDVIDDAAINTGKRDEGTYMGIRTFFARLSIAFQVILFAVIHTLTNYVAGDPGVITQSSEALFGIRLLIGSIPGILYIIAALIMWKIYSITLEKEKLLKLQLDELNL